MNSGVLIVFRNMEKIEEQIKKLQKYGLKYYQLCSWNPSLWTDENA